MNVHDRAVLWQQLDEAGLVTGEPPPPNNRHGTPFYVRAMLGIAGWMAAAFMLALVGLLTFMSGSGAISFFVIGALLCAAALFLYKSAPANDLLTQLAFALSLAGQAFVAFGLLSWLESETGNVLMFLFLAAIEMLLFTLSSNYLHRAWCALAGTGFVCLALASAGLAPLALPCVAAAFAGLCLGERRRRRWHVLLNPAMGAFAFALAAMPFILLSAMVDAGNSEFGELLLPLQTQRIGLALVLAAIAWQITNELGARPTTRWTLVTAGFALALVMQDASGITAALIIIVVGFARSRTFFLSLGIAALLLYLSHFYYALELTLLTKSGTLIAGGIVLVLAGLVLHRSTGAAPDA